MGARRLRYEAFAYEAVRAANRVTFSRDAIPQYDFASPDLVVSFGADFLETWLSTVGYSRDHAEGRRVRDGRKPRFVQIEPRMSLTGASADEWLTIEPGTEALVAAAMVFTIVSEQRVQVADLADEDANRILALVERPTRRSRSLSVRGWPRRPSARWPAALQTPTAGQAAPLPLAAASPRRAVTPRRHRLPSTC